MNRQENRRKALSGLLYKCGEIPSPKALTKKDMGSLLISVFNKNAEIYDQYQYMLDDVYSVEGDMYRYMNGDTRSEAEIIQDWEEKAKNELCKSLCYLVKWSCSAGYYEDPRDLVNYLYKSEKVRHLSAREQWLFENQGAGLLGALLDEDSIIELTPEMEYDMFVNRFLKVTGFTCRLLEFRYLMA